MPKFTDQEAKQLNSPPGDYILQVLSFDKTIATKGKISGSEIFELKCLVEKNADGDGGSELYENLIDHENCLWKLDIFLKSCGIKIAKGESYSFDKADAERQGIRFIDVIGLRGWATIGFQVEREKDSAGNWKNKTDPVTGKLALSKYNQVVTWITNKEKLPPVAANPDWD